MSFLLVLATLVLPVIAGADGRTALTGTVLSEDGSPLAGATVFIRTAAPRKGVGVL